MSIDTMIERTLGIEGKYANHPSDTGGETMWGITARVARKHGYRGQMKDLSREAAKLIYAQEFAIDPGFADVEKLSGKIGYELFDSGVNFGPAVPSIWLQRWLNGLNGRGKFYSDIKVDGDIGPGTLAALKSFLAKRGADGEKVLLRGLNASQANRYLELAEGRGANEDFLFGWVLNRVE